MNDFMDKCVKLCRLCDKFKSETCSVFDKTIDGKQVLHLIKDCLPIVVSTCFAGSALFYLFNTVDLPKRSAIEGYMPGMQVGSCKLLELPAERY